MNNPIKLLISGADMGGLIASCALRHDFHESSWHTDGFQIYRIEKDTLAMEDVDACDLSGIRYAVNATLHDNEASFAFDEICLFMSIVIKTQFHHLFTSFYSITSTTKHLAILGNSRSTFTPWSNVVCFHFF